MSSRAIPHRPKALDHLLTLREAMRRSGLSQWSLYRLAEQGEIRLVRRGDEGRAYYLESEIRALSNTAYAEILAA